MVKTNTPTNKRITVSVIPPKISGVHKWNFLGKISEEILNEEWTI